MHKGIFVVILNKVLRVLTVPWAAQGRDGVLIQGQIEKPQGCGTWEHGLVVALAVLGDSMILEVFSTLYNSMILPSPANLIDKVRSFIAVPDDILPRIIVMPVGTDRF